MSITLNKQNIPVYLRNSLQFKNLEDEDEFQIPLQFYKENDLVFSRDDWFKLFDVLSYWSANYIPSTMIMYALDHYEEIGEVFKAFRETSQNPQTFEVDVFMEFKKKINPLIKDKFKKIFHDEWCNLQFNAVLETQNKPWDYEMLSENHNITFDIVKANPDKPWDYYKLSQNKMDKAFQSWIETKITEYGF